VLGKDWNGKVGCAGSAIEEAKKLIEDLKAGRANYRKLAKTCEFKRSLIK